MLVLTRRIGEVTSLFFTLPDGSTVEAALAIDSVSGHQARVLFSAPESVRIVREELLSKPTPAMLDLHVAMSRGDGR